MVNEEISNFIDNLLIIFPGSQFNATLNKDELIFIYKDYQFLFYELGKMIKDYKRDYIFNEIYLTNTKQDSAEVLIKQHHMAQIDEHESYNIARDNKNKINYQILYPTDSYLIHILTSKDFFKKYCNLTIDKERFLEIKRYMLNNNEHMPLSDLLNIINSLFNLKTIQISSETPIDNNQLKELTLSYRFYLSYNEISNVTEVTTISKSHLNPKKREINLTNLYNPQLVHYYQQAVSTKDPVLKFLSYYHIIEYFYIKILDDTLNKAKEILKSERLEKYIQFNNNYSESMMLKIVLNDLININELITDLKRIKHGNSLTYYDFLITNDVSFSGGIKINNNHNELIESIADRIYATRNALVHRKKGEEKRFKYKYLPFSENETELKNELMLI